MLSFFRKPPSRRAEIRRNRPDTVHRRWELMKASGVPASLAIAAAFALIAMAILSLREEVVPHRPGQFTAHDIVSRVNFTFHDTRKLAEAQRAARAATPRVYTEDPELWTKLEGVLMAVPNQIATAASPEELREPLNKIIDSGTFDYIKPLAAKDARREYDAQIQQYLSALRGEGLIILDPQQRAADENRLHITIRSADGTRTQLVSPATTFDTARRGPIENRLQRLAAANLRLPLQPKIVALTLHALTPTHLFDESATNEAQNKAEAAVGSDRGNIEYERNIPLVKGGNEITDRDWQLLKAETQAFNRTLDESSSKRFIGLAATVLIVTIILSAYVAMFQPKVVRKHARAIAIAALLLSMLLLGQVSGIGSNPIHVFAVAPTILVAMILAIAYDQRFAMGVATLHALLVTVAVGEGLGFFLILLAGLLTCCFLLDDIRSRSKLIEVGGGAALAMMAATAAAGLIALDPLIYIGKNCMYTGAAGIAVGFVVLGILPFIEKSFRITTSMTLLELADASHPLLRRLSIEAPGTYNHSLQVATIAEHAAESVGANSLLCRVAAYYHDVGKINKADYFIENQQRGQNRHLNLSPSVSLLIIIGHVKDGIELAKEYNLPTSIFPFIQQHHGTTLVEYFYHRACNLPQQQSCDAPAISETQYRYPGPKPRSRESAILMIADAAESATRAMPEPNAGRIEALVEDLIMKRLLDGQFDECDLTMRELETIRRACVKILLGIYHGRIAYPSNAAAAPSAPSPAARTA
ncbi:MAG TPA: HDIG domain-containing protein [Tepidisphaeraceae bacterium]|nr:HDIG domain-containing protein [Tepidisphaeraceae bacterium]